MQYAWGSKQTHSEKGTAIEIIVLDNTNITFLKCISSIHHRRFAAESVENYNAWNFQAIVYMCTFMLFFVYKVNGIIALITDACVHVTAGACARVCKRN